MSDATDTDTEKAVHQMAEAHLRAVVAQASETIGCSPVAFIILTLGILARDLARLDPTATAVLLRALAAIHYPAGTTVEKSEAVAAQNDAFDHLTAAYALHVAPPEGRA